MPKSEIRNSKFEILLRISVAIPVRNEEQSIGQLLDCLQNQTLAPAEILVTDGGSTDRTAQIIEEHNHGPIPVRLIRAGQALPGRGRNLAAAQAENEWVAFVDAGVRPEPTWLESLAKRAQGTTDVDVVYGNYEPVTDTLFKLCAVMTYVAPPSEIDGKLVRPRSIASALMKRSVWQSVGGFPEDLRSAEDLVFMNRIDSACHRVTTAPEALVHWQVQPTMWRTFRRFIEYARSNMRAGLWRQWQAAIFKRYGFLLIIALTAIMLGSRWLVVPLLLWLALLVARALVAIRRNRVCYPAGVLQIIIRAIVMVPILAMLDVATIIGTVQWALGDRLYVSKHSESISQ